MNLPVVYDLDGTLIDTRKAVIKAYEAAGVVMPKDAWGKPWQEWTTEEAHELKNGHYSEMLKRHAKPMHLLMRAVKERSPVITGASKDAVMLVKQIFAPTLNVCLTGATIKDKIKYISNIGPCGVYVDDSQEVRDAVEKESMWVTFSPNMYIAYLASCSRQVLTPDSLELYLRSVNHSSQSTVSR